jgi:hypothetical protein
VLIEVQDTGVGIAPENMSQLFNAFFTTKQNGMGMDCRFAAPSSKHMGAGYGRPAMPGQVRLSILLCRLSGGARDAERSTRIAADRFRHRRRRILAQRAHQPLPVGRVARRSIRFGSELLQSKLPDVPTAWSLTSGCRG